MRRSRSKLILAGVLTVLTAIAAGAYGQPVRQEWQPAHQQCAGLLRADLDGRIYFEVPPEGICEIAKSERAKVLARCRVNSICHVEGIAAPCKDRGECSEVLQVLSAARGQ